MLLRILVISSLLAILFWVYLTFTELGFIPSPVEYYFQFLYIIAIFFVSGIFLLYAGNRIESIFPWHRSTNLRFGIGSLANSIIGLVLFTAFGLLYKTLFYPDYTLAEFMDAYRDPLLKLFILLFVSVIAFTVIDFAVHTYKKYTTGQIETARIMREQLNLQFEALKKQMSPHFLFNSLNTISSLIYRSNDLAEAFIRKLALTYQSVLKYHDKQLIPLVAELELVKSYGYLMSVRYEKAMEIETDVDKSLNGKLVPPLSIQMLVENAIKHNQLSYENPLKIKIYCEDDYLFVRNNFIGLPRYITIHNNLVENPLPAGSHQIGLENIKRRYYYLTRKKIVIEKNSFFKVGIPLLKPIDEG